ncbi:MAG: hypothetical protein IPK69_06395 [Phycisphaerales bacterium]|nr:MAG: hypothetical protein IPK69_06395 [Phycisphaerales bacterium]
MLAIHKTFDAAINEVTKARARVTAVKTKQVKNVDTVASLKATAQAWFHAHKPVVVAAAPGLDLVAVDQHYTTILNSTAKHAAKQTYLDALMNAKTALVAARTIALIAPAVVPVANTDDLAPDFSPLAGNQEMRDILTRRWHECAKCVKADAHLAAIVMMGGLLEALFVARANKLTDKAPLTGAANAPKDKATGKTTNYQDWMLDSYIKVGCELNWITESAKNVADTLKEYRNFVHPAKELRYGVKLGFNDSSIFWQVTKALARQLLFSA